MTLTSLTGPQGGSLTIALAAAPTAPAVEVLARVHVKTFKLHRRHSMDDKQSRHDDEWRGREFTFKNVPVQQGVATVELGRLDRGSLVRAHVEIRSANPARPYELRGETTALLRPDFVVTAVQAPLQTLTTRPIDVQAEIAEVNGDTAGTASVTLLWGPSFSERRP
jgi:hypothetical protein